MKKVVLFFGLLLSVQCSSVRVFADHDSAVDFSTFTTFAFYKPGIEALEISDLDKRRILAAVEESLVAKGMTLDKNPDLLVNIAAKATDRVVVSQNFGWGGWGWGGWGFCPWGGPWMMGGPGNTVSTQTRGKLFIDLIAAKDKKLVWQGKGTGGLTEYGKKRDARIRAFVTQILAQYPPTEEDE